VWFAVSRAAETQSLTSWNIDDQLYVGTSTGNLYIYKLGGEQGASLSLLEDHICRRREDMGQMRLKDRQ